MLKIIFKRYEIYQKLEQNKKKELDQAQQILEIFLSLPAFDD